ncbi:hypothetical protein CLOM_g13034 [Closterium sp. NIES-68]|nr:hypothetical protein CLOM_g13034 [Closterium sp. NIES-68]GJP84495.1 hypothetical protein CLOP_g14558 [Closterium sp. NIES-67]
MFPTGSGTGALVAAQIKPFRGAIATFALVLVFWSASFASQRDALRQGLRPSLAHKAQSHEVANPPLTAVCLVGGARDFEASGPSILHHLLPAYRPLHLFLLAPLDDKTSKLWALLHAAADVDGGDWSSGGSGAGGGGGAGAGGVKGLTIGGVRIVPNTDVTETRMSHALLTKSGSPHGVQGLLQYFRLVEGCVDLIAAHEQAHSVTFHWVLRSRVDAFWTAPPPPLWTLDPGSYSVPYGWGWGGVNDRFGIGGREVSEVALRRLSVLPALFQAGKRLLNSEGAFEAQLQLRNVTVKPLSLPFCVLTRRGYGAPRPNAAPTASSSSSSSSSGGGNSGASAADGNGATSGADTGDSTANPTSAPSVCSPLLVSLSSATRTAANGAKCCPCQPCAQGEEAISLIHAYNETSPYRVWLGHPPAGVQLCPAHCPWGGQGEWERRWGEVVGEGMERQRREIVAVAGRVEECVKAWEEFQQASSAWQAPSALAVCLRSHLGEVQLLGGHGGNFNTLIGLLDERSTVITIGTNKSDTTWEASLGDHVPGIHVSNQAADWLNAGSGQGSPTTLIDALKVDIGALEQGDGTSWASSLAGLAVCQLLVRIAGTEAAAWQQLQQAVQPHGFQLDSCKMGLLVESWRCTFFSLKHCNIKEGNAFEHA